MCDNTRLLFCTTGVLLRRLERDPTLAGVTHVLVDEALPPHSSVEELAALAGNHVTKEGKQRAAAWGAMCAAVDGKSGLGLPAAATATAPAACGAHRAGACTCWACRRRRCARRCGAWS